MSIKVINTNEIKQNVKSFPKLMIGKDGEIVFFIRHGYGLPINGKGWDYNLISGSHWIMEVFTDYNEPITIQND